MVKKQICVQLDPDVLKVVDTIYPGNRAHGIRELVDLGLEVKKNEILEIE